MQLPGLGAEAVLECFDECMMQTAVPLAAEICVTQTRVWTRKRLAVGCLRLYLWCDASRVSGLYTSRQQLVLAGNVGEAVVFSQAASCRSKSAFVFVLDFKV
jgi:hypothetical protein